MNNPGDNDAGDNHESKWYQTTIREMLLLTTLVALVLSMLNIFGIEKIWATVCGIALFAWPCVEVFLLFRRVCKEHEIWDPPELPPVPPKISQTVRQEVNQEPTTPTG